MRNMRSARSAPARIFNTWCSPVLHNEQRSSVFHRACTVGMSSNQPISIILRLGAKLWEEWRRGCFDDDENTLTLLAFITQVREVKLFLGGFRFHAFWPWRSIHCWAPFHLRETLSKVTKPMHNSDQNRKPSIVTCAKKSEMA